MLRDLESEEYQTVARQLEVLRVENPEEDTLFKWVFVAKTINTGDLLNNKVESINVERPSDTNDSELIKQGKFEFKLYSLFLKNFFNKNANTLETEKFAAWNQQMQTCAKTSMNTHFIQFHGDSDMFYRQVYGPTPWSKRAHEYKLAVYTHHQGVYERFKLTERLTTSNVNAAIEDMKDGRKPDILKKLVPNAPGNVQSALDVPIPELSDDKIAEMVAAVEPNSYEGINSFGNEIQREFARRLQTVGEYFILNASRPRCVSEKIGQIISQIRDEAAASKLVRAMPTNVFDRWAGRNLGVQLTSPEDMPLARAVDMAKELPDLAEKDDEQFSQDLKIADHGINICAAYENILKRMQAALEADRDRLVTVSEGSTATEIFGHAHIPEAFEGKITALRNSQAFLNYQAGNFGSLGRILGEYQRNVGGMAAVASAIQLPAMDAIRKFNLYQVQRMRAFGNAISVGMFESLNVDPDDITSLGTASRDDVATQIKAAHAEMLEKLSSELSGFDMQIELQKRAAFQIVDQAAEEAAGRFEIPEAT